MSSDKKNRERWKCRKEGVVMLKTRMSRKRMEGKNMDEEGRYIKDGGKGTKERWGKVVVRKEEKDVNGETKRW